MMLYVVTIEVNIDGGDFYSRDTRYGVVDADSEEEAVSKSQSCGQLGSGYIRRFVFRRGVERRACANGHRRVAAVLWRNGIGRRIGRR